MEELLEYLARQLVDSPDEVRVERFERDWGEVLLELHVAEAVRGKVIGKGGRIARALRTVVKASAVRSGRRVHVEIAAWLAPRADRGRPGGTPTRPRRLRASDRSRRRGCAGCGQ